MLFFLCRLWKLVQWYNIILPLKNWFVISLLLKFNHLNSSEILYFWKIWKDSHVGHRYRCTYFTLFLLDCFVDHFSNTLDDQIIYFLFSDINIQAINIPLSAILISWSLAVLLFVEHMTILWQRKNEF